MTRLQQSPLIVVREMQPDDARTFLEVHRLAVRGTAAKDYPLAVIEAWAPMPLTDEAIAKVRANPDKEHRLIAEIDGRVVGIGSVIFESCELRACYVTPEAARKGVGTALIQEIEHAALAQGLHFLELDSSLTAERFYRKEGYMVRERGEHVLRTGQRMACVKMSKNFAA